MSSSLITGLGFDAHRFADEDHPRPFFLATLQWDGNGIEGDSDGDVVVHALIDAIGSASGLGDIGTLFGVGPDSHGAGMSGKAMLREVMERLYEHHCMVESASIVVIGNRPKFAARRLEAQQALSQLCDCQVSISATTTDHMGFTGRGEGIASIAHVLVRRATR